MKGVEVDTSGFQNIVLMLIGVLMVMLISNVITIISNPDNIKIGALVTGAVFDEEEDEKAESFVAPKFQNMLQNPYYVDVEPNQLTVYDPPQRLVIPARDLQLPGNEFEDFLEKVEARKATRYIILLLRPGSARFQRKLRQIIRDRGIDVGFEPWEAGREIMILGVDDINASTEEGAADAPAGDAPAAAAEDTPAAETPVTEAPAAEETAPEEGT